jgi:hypothetical protein
LTREQDPGRAENEKSKAVGPHPIKKFQDFGLRSGKALAERLILGDKKVVANKNSLQG